MLCIFLFYLYCSALYANKDAYTNTIYENNIKPHYRKNIKNDRNKQKKTDNKHIYGKETTEREMEITSCSTTFVDDAADSDSDSVYCTCSQNAKNQRAKQTIVHCTTKQNNTRQEMQCYEKITINQGE